MISVTIGRRNRPLASCGLLRGPGRGLLLGVVGEDGRAVLGADVGPLAVRGGRVVDRPEDVEELVVGDLLGVVVDLDDLGVAGPAGADVAIGRVGERPARVADGDVGDPLDLAEGQPRRPRNSPPRTWPSS